MKRAPANLPSKRYFGESSLKLQALVEVPTKEALKPKAFPGFAGRPAKGFPVMLYLLEMK